MVSSKTFDLTVNTFGDFVNEVFAGTDENQKIKLRTKLNQFFKISNGEWNEKTDGQIANVQIRKKRLSDVQNILPPEMLEKILKLLNLKDISRAKLVCRRWNGIIETGNLVKKASGKTFTILLLFVCLKYCHF